MGGVESVHAHNVVISNVAGPREKRYVNGALIESEYPMSLLVPGRDEHHRRQPRGLPDVAVLVCPDLVPQPHLVSAGIADALTELERALRPDARPDRPPARPPARPHSPPGRASDEQDATSST